MPIKNPQRVAQLAARTLRCDLEDRLLKIDRYAKGEQDHPYTPDTADQEYVDLARKSVTNVMPFLLNTPKQMMKGDSFRRGTTSVAEAAVHSSTVTNAVQPEWDHWQNSSMDGKQTAIYEGALKFGHSFVLTYTDDKRGKVLSKGLSALRTVALYEDPANDIDAYAALHVKRYASGDPEKPADYRPGLATMWDDTYEYPVTFRSLEDEKSIAVGAGKRHGASDCPVTRFAAAVDLEGRTCGVVEPMFVLQDRINQTVFDLLIVQSFASFKVRTIAGMAPPIKMKPVDEDGNTVTNPTGEDDPRIFEWRPVIDPSTGAPVYDEINLNARRVFLAEDHETKFGTLDETPLDGFISAIELAFRHMAALSQTPPHHILGEISNLSAEALEAAELSLARKVDEFKTSFGESWERVFRIAAQIEGRDGAEDFAGELIWRDQHNASLAQSADALQKLTQLGIPGRALWHRIPNITANELAMMEKMRQEEPQVALANATTQAGTTTTRPTFRSTTTSPAAPVSDSQSAVA